ncbi:hypothetical protein E2C01_015416 [Portunus trituberculatus]|uniref:Uncharacterized protein n=1 Tax=Portunus trituberculatus TaxID=210409 RepID=A0A5B7DLH2_PORTR|nr:hypothetical protein [Portunus trituberculatus]
MKPNFTLFVISTELMRSIGLIHQDPDGTSALPTDEVVFRGADDGAVPCAPHQVTIAPTLLCDFTNFKIVR